MSSDDPSPRDQPDSHEPSPDRPDLQKRPADPSEYPDLRKRPDARAGDRPGAGSNEPAGLGDPSQQASWGDPAYGQPGGPGYGDPGYGASGQPGYGDPAYGQPGFSQPPSYAPQPYPAQPSGYQPPPFGSLPPGPMPPPYSPYPAPSNSNGYAVAALVTGICGFLCCVPGLVGIGLGVAGLNQAKRTGVGRGMSIAGICLGAAWALLGVGWLIVSVAISN